MMEFRLRTIFDIPTLISVYIDKIPEIGKHCMPSVWPLACVRVCGGHDDWTHFDDRHLSLCF